MTYVAERVSHVNVRRIRHRAETVVKGQRCPFGVGVLGLARLNTGGPVKDGFPVNNTELIM